MACGTSGNNRIDAAGEKIGCTMHIWKAGNIRNVWLYMYAVTEEDNLKVSLQSVSSALVPSGTILGATNQGYATATMLDTDDSKWIGPFQLTEDVAVTMGQYLALVVEFSSWTDGDVQVGRNGNAVVGYIYETCTCTAASLTSGTLTAGRGYYIRSYVSDDDFTNVGASSNAAGVTFVATGTTPTHWEHASALGLWSRVSVGQYCIALEYDDGTYAIGNFGAAFNNTINVNTGSTPDEVGNYIQFPAPFTAIGFWIRVDADYGGTMVLYDASDNVLANGTLQAFPGESNAFFYVIFDGDPASSVSIAANTYYRITFLATSGSSTGVQYLLVPEASARAAYDLGANCVYTARADSGAWTETDTRLCQMGLIASTIDNGVSTGGSSPRFGDMTGGLR